MFCYSANDNAGVVRVMNSHVQFLESIQRDAGDSLLDYSYTLGCRRSNLEWKGFIIAESASDLVAKIQVFDTAHLARSSLKKQHKLGFVFCGQGAQWAKMGADLMSFNVYSASLKEASCFLQIVLGSRFDLLKEILRGGEDTRISDPEISQPATTALQVALVDLLKSFDIQPKYVLGHSSGEIAAAYASGAISRYDAWRIAYYRGLAAASIPFRASKLKGGMMVVGMSTEEVSAYLARINKSAQIACINSPRSITISGQAEAIEFIAHDLRQKNIFNRVLNVKVAYHSSHMKLVEDDYVAALDEIVSSDCFEGVRMFSSVTGKEVTGGELNAKYWADNMVSPVQYVAAVQSLMSLPPDDLPDALIELSPSAVLRSPTADVLAAISGATSPAYYSVLERKRNGSITIFDLIGKLWSRGYPVNMKNVVSKGHEQESLRCLSNLPSYVWDHSKKYWHETDMSRENRLREYPRMDLIGYKVSDSIASFEPIWRGFLRISENPWIQDHQVQKTIVYPAAGMVSMVLEGAKQLSKDSQNLLGYELVNMSIEKAMTIPNTAYGLEVALSMKKDPTSTDSHDKIGIRSFVIYSRPQGRSWDRHASGNLRFHYKVGNWQTAFQTYEGRQRTMSEICKKPIIPRQLYEQLDSIGMNYGPLFQNIVEVRKCDGHCVSRIKIPDTKAKMPAKFEYPHLLHPATLDSMIQTLLAIQSSPMVPVFIRSLFVAANLGGAKSGADFTGYSSVSTTGIRNAEATIVMKQASLDQAYVVIEGLSLTALPRPSPEEGGFLPSNRNLCSQIMWKEDATFARPNSYIEQIAVLAHKYPGLSVLQIGGDYQLSLATLGAVSPDPDATPQLLRYTILEADGEETASRILSYAKDTFLQPFIETISDLSGINNDYHLIVACADVQADIDLLKTKLKAGGVLLEQVTDLGSNKRQIDEAKSTPFIGNSQAITNNHLLRDNEDLVHFIEGKAAVHLKAHRYNQPSRLTSPVVIITPKEVGSEVKNFIAAINQIRETGNIPFDVSSMAVDEAVEDPSVIDGKTVISLLEFSGLMSHDCSIFEWEKEDFDAFRVIQRRADHVFWVTRGALMSCENPRGSPIVGLSRTLISEDPLNSIVTFDIESKSKLGDPTVVNNVLRLLDATFGSKPGPLQDTEFAEEGGKIYIPRLKTLRSINRIIEGKALTGKLSQKLFANNSGLQLTIEGPGISEDNLFFIKSELPELGADEVEIAFKEAPLSVLDLEIVLGRSHESTIGVDVRGKITRVGSEVRGLAAGDNVVALVADGSIKNFVRVKSQFVKRVATDIVPSFLVSAYFALIHIGRVKRGRKVLIHNGASAFGLTAIDIAIAIGAEVFATIVGPETDRQREILERHGISREHILEADSGLFVAALLGATDGNGVDCVFNPTLEAFDVQFDCVRKCKS